MGKLILITGGARCGKSAFAEKFAQKNGKKVAYIATSQIKDVEMEYRIKLHQERRPAEWDTYEAPFNTHEAIMAAGKSHDMLLLDCLTVYTSNILCNVDICSDADSTYQNIKTKCRQLLAAVEQTEATVVMVTNEVGSGIVPMNRLSREFRDLAGLVNQMIAEKADTVYLVVAGILVDIKKLAEKI